MFFFLADRSSAQELGRLFIFGFLTDLALPPFGFFPVLFISTAVLLIGIEKSKNAFQAFQRGWVFGTGFFVGGVYWFTIAFFELMQKVFWFFPMAVFGIPIYLGFFFGVAALCAFLFRRRPVFFSVIFTLSLFWIEYFRGHFFVNFPWNLWGYSFYRVLPIFQILSVIGIYGLTLFAIWSSTFLYLLLKKDTDNKSARMCFTILICWAVVLIFGTQQLIQNPTRYHNKLAVQVLQPNIRQADKENDALSDEVFESHVRLAKSDKLNPKMNYLSVWPETVFGMMPGTRLDYFKKIADTLPNNSSYAVVGLYDSYPYDTTKIRVYNTLVAVNKSGAVQARHNKYSLAPWGETIPFENLARHIFSAESLNMLNIVSPGPGPSLFRLPDFGTFNPMICYESAFAGSVKPKNGRGDFIVLSSNEDWTLNTSEPYQSHVQAIARAVEEGLPIIKSSNSGISAIIDANGRTLGSIGIQERATIVSALPLPNPPGTYSRYGDRPLLIFASLATLLCLCLAGSRKTEKA